MSLSRIILVITMAITGCAGASGLGVDPGASASPSPPPEQPAGTSPSSVIELSYDETVQHQQLEIRWLTLKDSRCPIGVNCVWAGQIQASIEVVHSEHGTSEVKLLRRAARQPEVADAYGYEFRLREVLPNPKANVIPDRAAYRMFVEISQP